MPSAQLIQLGEALQEKRKSLYEKAQEASEGKYNKEQWEEFDRLKKELDDPDEGLGVKYQRMLQAESVALEVKRDMEAHDKPVYRFGPSTGLNPGEAVERKSLGQLVVESKNFINRNFNNGQFKLEPETQPETQEIFNQHGVSAKLFVPNVQTKTLMTTSAGFAPPNYRTDLVVFYPQNQPDLIDIIPQFNTDLQIIKYMRGTTATNNAAAAAEGAVGTDSVLVFTEQSDTVQKIVGWIPVTDEQLSDVENIMEIIDNQLSLQVRLALQTECITGSGTTPHLTGFLNVPNVQTQARGGDSGPDAIYKGMIKVRFTGRALPTNIAMHPNNWQFIQLLTNQIGDYIWGSPASQVAQPFIWGLPVSINTDVTANTALLGDFLHYCRLGMRKDLAIETGYINDDFTKGKKTVKGTIRAALEVSRPEAFCTVTGLQ